MNSNNYVDSEKQVENTEVKNESLSVKDIFSRLRVFGLGIIIGLILCSVALWAVSLVGLYYVWTTVLAFVFTLVFLFTFEEVTGLKMARIKIAILATIFVFFVGTLLSGYGKSDKSYRNEPEVSHHVMSWKSETFTFVGKERWVSHASVSSGGSFRITINGAPINFVNGNEKLTQEHGTYVYEVESNSKGDLIFLGNGTKSTATIEWLE